MSFNEHNFFLDIRLMKLYSTPEFISTHNAALRVVFIYAGFSLLWILFSDQILFYFVNDAEILTKIQMLKGWAFVIVSAVILYVLLLQEITKVKQAEESLSEGEKNYREIFNATSEAIFIHNAENGEILDANNSASDMFGYSHEEIHQLTINDLSSGEHPYSQQKAVEFVNKAVEQGPQLFEWKSRKKSGEFFWSEVALKSSVVGGEGRVVAIVRDVTERKLAVEALRGKNRALKIANEVTKATINAMDEDALLQDSCKIIVDYGGYLLAWIGYARHDENKTVCPVARYGYEEGYLETAQITWGDGKRGQGPTGTAIRYKKPIAAQDILNDPKFKPWRDAAAKRGYKSSLALPLLDKDECIGALNIYSKDSDAFDTDEVVLLTRISSELLFGIKTLRTRKEKQQVEDAKEKIVRQLNQAQKMEAIGTLAGGIAHDFNNILSAILGYTDMALLDLPEGSKVAKDLEKVLKAGYRAADLVKQILTFSRRSDQELKPLRIQLVIKEALRLLRSSIPTTIEIKQNINPDCEPILADPTQIHQVIMNLCTNAYHAMREAGGILSISLEPVNLTSEDLNSKINLYSGSYAKLRISDTGCGIAKDNLGKVIEPYFTTKAKEEGTGLGLAVVHGIVLSLGGDITIYSEPGKGTVFHVYLPVIGETKEVVQDNDTAPLPTGIERIILVDDDEELAQMNKRMLESLGYKVTALTSSVDTLNIFQKEPDRFDLVLTDMTMPQMTGAELSEKILAVRPDVPIILCTGFSELINEEKAKKIGIRDFVMKPVVKKNLAGAVRKVLDERIS